MAPGLISTDGARTWTRVGAFAWPLVVDAANAEVAYSGVRGNVEELARTEDGGETWTPVSPPWQDSGEAVATCRAPYSCLYVRRSSWTEEGQHVCFLSRSQDQGRTWLEHLRLPDEMCSGQVEVMALSPVAPEHLLAGCSGGLCETRDGGQSWVLHAFGFPPGLPIDSVVFLNDGVALASTSMASQRNGVVARSVDGGSTWAEVADVGGTLRPSFARPETVFLVTPVSNLPDLVSRSDDSGVTWRVVFPDEANPSPMNFHVLAIVDAPDGGFVAATTYGLVQLR